MTMKLQFTLILAAATLAFRCADAQDYHLTQYDAATLYLNPALTGAYASEKTDYRIYADYRSQWNALSGKPFTTSYLAYDMPYKRFGFGGFLVNNHAGSSGFNTFSLFLSGSYQIMAPGNKQHSLTVGAQAGLMNKSFKPDQFTFDTQYSPTSTSGFDQGLSSGEVFSKTNVMAFDANMGVYYKSIAKIQTVRPFGGFSVYHVTMPDESFTSETSRVPLRYAVHGGADIQVHEKLKIVPSCLFMYQGAAHEVNAGVLGYYSVKDSGFDLVFGLNHRLDDAVIVQFGLKHGGHVFRISYDIHSSYLGKYSGPGEAIEFSLLLSGRRGEPLFSF